MNQNNPIDPRQQRQPIGRRTLLKGLGALMSAWVLNVPFDSWSQGTPTGSRSADANEFGPCPRRPLGRTGVEVSILALGGSHLGRLGSEREAARLVHEALDAGLTFMDNAWEYHGGRSEEWMGKALQGRRQQAFLMTKVCSHGRDKAVALQQLEDSLRRLRTDYLDLWQIHEVIYEDDPERHFRPGGAAEALLEAKRQGKVRFIGFTGHKDPAIHLKMLSYDFPFDTCQLPLNCFDGTFRSFEQQVLPELERQGIAALGMKTLSGNGAAVNDGIVTVEEALRYALTLPVASIVSGIDSLEVLHHNLAIARRFMPMTASDMERLRTQVSQYAASGRYELFKTSRRYDGPIGRLQHGLAGMPTLST